jgi:hypothetical protein
LHTHVQLSMDHAFVLSKFWKFSDLEQEYFLTLLQLARSGRKEYRAHLHEKMAQMKEQNANLAKRFQKPRIESDKFETLYYTNWHMGAIHFILTIPKYRKAETIALRLGLPLTLAESSLKLLEEMGLAKYSKATNTWTATQSNIHLPKVSPVSPINHMVWRQKAYTSIFHPEQKNLHYTGVHTLSQKDLERIRSLLTESIEKARAIIDPSLEEELVCLCLDFFVI